MSSNQRKPLQISACTLVTALGVGLEENWNAIEAQRSGLSQCDFEDVLLNTYVGCVAGLENQSMPDGFSAFDGRNNRLAFMGAQLDDFSGKVARAKQRYGAHRVGLVLGTTTSGFLQAEHAYKATKKQDKLPANFPYQETAHPFATTLFLQQYFKLKGPTITIGTACSSSAKAFIHADHWISAGLCDAVVVAGVDSLCRNILYGFQALGILSNQPCRPFDSERNGLSLGEAAGFALVETSHDDNKIKILGYGESSDAYHMSSPHPDGTGVINSMNQALKRAQLSAEDIDYINAHGTASGLNDHYESKAIFDVFSRNVSVSSTKGWTGHTLGTAGVIELIISSLCLEKGIKPGTLNSTVIDPKVKAKILLSNTEAKINRILSNSCGFGGNNCSLIIGK